MLHHKVDGKHHSTCWLLIYALLWKHIIQYISHFSIVLELITYLSKLTINELTLSYNEATWYVQHFHPLFSIDSMHFLSEDSMKTSLFTVCDVKGIAVSCELMTEILHKICMVVAKWLKPQFLLLLVTFIREMLLKRMVEMWVIIMR